MNHADHLMSHALRLAEKGLWSTHPNPRVGCVLVKNGGVVGEGWHQIAGQAHAEINALAQAGKKAQGADCYVTLEPCCHHGKTPPCTDALIQAGVKRVFVALQDPNPLMAGQGIQKLQAAGIKVHVGLLQSQAAALNIGFLQRMQHGRPYIRCKMAMSLDGRTAMASGESQWITHAHARRDVQTLRARSNAIMTGAGTVLADDPSLTVRLGDLPDTHPRPDSIEQPLRVIIDQNLSVSDQSRLFKLAGDTLIFTASDDDEARERLEQAGARILYLPNNEGGVNLLKVCQELAQWEVNEVLLESGATLSGAMLSAGLIDEFIIYLAPTLLGHLARPLFHLPLQQMSERLFLTIDDIRAVGQDWRISAHLQNPL
jgi:diaminohydroxyphosphoribosylaminopyrimidine deaminase/5-amino-6-(5-phosphoribosylamino)uracil reductase